MHVGQQEAGTLCCVVLTLYCSLMEAYCPPMSATR